MDFTLSEEQTLLKNSVERFVEDAYDFTARTKLARSDDGFSRKHWSLFAEQGWLAVPFSADDGGLDCGPAETMVLMEAFGRGLVLEPYLATVILGGGFLRRGGSAEQRTETIPAIIEGAHLMAFAHQEPEMRHNPSRVAMTAKKDGDGFVLNGTKRVVVHGMAADSYIVSARTGGKSGERDGLTLFHIPADSAGLSRRGYRSIDGLPAADLTFDTVRAAKSTIVGEVDGALPLVERVIGEANTALCAEAVGAMHALLDATLEYVKTRKQFGRTLGSFQAVQHRMADMLMNVEQARGITLLATLTADRGEREWLRNVSAAKALVARLSRAVGHEAIQFHGGIGMTDELNISHYHKRLLMIQSLFGDAAYHNRTFRSLQAA